MKSLPTTIEYNDINKINEQQFEKMLADVNPELWRVFTYLRDTQVNPRILPRVIRGIYNVSTSRSKNGQIIVYVQNEEVQIQIRENDYEKEKVFDKQF